jgi:iron complex outermembrane receptor protein
MKKSTPQVARPQRLPLVIAMLAALPVLAQQPPAAADQGKLDAVIITATKRPQPLQNTPIAISVVNGAALEEANINTLGAITQQTPTVNFRTNASNKDTAIFIRGVGTISTSPGVEPTVSTVLDGVVTSRPGQATMDLVDIDRVEILRGPQGTLFGRNASAGVINIVSRAPSKATERYIDVSWFEGNERRIRFGASGELLPDTVRGSISLMAGKFDGNVTNGFDGSSVNGYDRSGARGRLDITPNKKLKISLIGDYMTANDDTPTGVPFGTTTTAYATGVVTQNPLYAAAVAPVVPSPTNNKIFSEMRTRVADTNSGFSGQVDWEMDGGYQLTSITAYRKWDNTQFQDQDRTATLYRQFARTADKGDLAFNQTSQELRIASPRTGSFDYVAGLFYIQGKVDEQYRRDVTRCNSTTATALPSGLIPCSAGSQTADNGVATYGVTSKSVSVFGEGNFTFSDTLRGIAGLRYTSDDLSYFHGRIASAAGVPGVAATRATVNGATTENAFSGRIGPQWALSKDVMAYATWSKGYKGPAYNVFFNMSPTQDNVLKPEVSNSLEAGIKSTLMDNTLRLNVAVFKTDYANYQANVPDLVNGTIVTRLINAGDVSTKGIEMDLTARITPQFTVNASVANIIARVDNFNCPPNAAVSCNINGRPLPFSPDWKGSLRAKYTMPLGDALTLDWNGEYNWQSEVQYDLAQSPDAIQPAYGILNASVGLASSSGWRVAFLVKNLLNQSYASFLQNSGSNINRYVPRDDQRYMGINARYEF